MPNIGVASIGWWIAPLALALVVLLAALRVAKEYQRAVIFRLGRVAGLRGPGLYLVLPLIERATVIDIRTITYQLETQETVTKDGVAVRINAVVWYKSTDPVKVLVEVADYQNAVVRAAETALRDTIGQNELDSLLKDRLNANAALKDVLSRTVARWGIEIVAVELKDLDIPEVLQRAIAREAEAIREKRARIIKAEGEQEAAAKLRDAAAIMGASSGALELRRLQTLTEIGAEHNSVIIMALPPETGPVATALSINQAMKDLAERPQ